MWAEAGPRQLGVLGAGAMGRALTATNMGQPDIMSGPAGLLAAAAASFVGVALVLRFLPARHKPAAVPHAVPVVAVEMRAAA